MVGPDIDWSLIKQELVLDPETSLRIPTKFMMTKYDSDKYNMFVNTITTPETSPKEAMLLAMRILVSSTKCDQLTEEQPEFLLDDNLNGYFVYVYPKQRENRLDTVTRVHYGLGRTDGKWTCDPIELREGLEKMDWSDKLTWDDLIQ